MGSTHNAKAKDLSEIHNVLPNGSNIKNQEEWKLDQPRVHTTTCNGQKNEKRTNPTGIQ